MLLMVYVICGRPLTPTCSQEQGNNLAGLDVGHSVEERSLSHRVHVMYVGPQSNANLDNVHPVAAWERPGTAGLVQD